MFEASFQVSQIGPVNVVTLILPELMDSQEIDRLNDEILPAISASPKGGWVFDLANLSYMGSSALGLMVNLRQRIRELGGQLVLCNVSPQLSRILRTCCLERLFDTVRTREDALRQLSR
ncbi:MAG TPA: STAS domain-containing protein [Tepidisphaeraceae bacterium]|jgi:anti-anti-sigma factor|nr:STAS domain-containing protein [Tepidisphaeraceae bacterium]